MKELEKILKSGLKREDGWLYFLDKKGNVARSKMLRGLTPHNQSSIEIIVKSQIAREPGWLYFIDRDGDVARVRMEAPSAEKDALQENKSVTKKAAPTKSLQQKKKPKTVREQFMRKSAMNTSLKFKKKIKKKK